MVYIDSYRVHAKRRKLLRASGASHCARIVVGTWQLNVRSRSSQAAGQWEKLDRLNTLLGALCNSVSPCLRANNNNKTPCDKV
jgi:hypothetical protein